MHSIHGVHRHPRASHRFHALCAALVAFLFLACASMDATAQALDIARAPITQIPANMTSRNIAIHGVTLGMPWSSARNVLDRSNVPYIFQKGATPVVYIPPTNPTYYFVLNSSSYEITEMGIIGVSDLPIDNQYLFDAQRWRLTTARMQFFGNEGEYIVSEDGEAYNYPYLGFVLKYINPSGFRFIMLTPTNKPLTTYGQQLGGTTAPAPQTPRYTEPQTPPPPPQQQQPGDNLQKMLSEFQDARNNFENHNYSAALSGFRYVASTTDDPLLRVRSTYWMGESYYGMKDYRNAKKQFQQVLQDTDIASLRDPAQLMIQRCNNAMR